MALILAVLGWLQFSATAATNAWTRLDLMVLYTPAACKTTGGKGAMRATVLPAVVEANQVLTNSQIQATLQLAPTVARGRIRPESPPSLQLASGVVPPDGPFELLLGGETGRAYQAQTSEALRQWLDWTNLVLEGTCARLTDETARLAPCRFYRVVAR